MQTGSFLATVVLLGICGASDAGLATHDSPVQPALDLITRNFGPNAAAAFTLELKPSVPCSAANETAQAPCFSLKLINGKVVVTASSMAELTYGIGHYTRFQCGLTVGWARGGNSYSNIPGLSWPCHQQEFQSVALARVVPYTYQDNVCTHSYSYVWYDESAWMSHIDWMALQGINIFLALTGQEEIQYKTFLKFGLKDVDIREFFNGPAYLTWSRGQSMQSVGSSAMPEGGNSGLPRSWMMSQWELQKKILARTRPLGIIGVLPAFQGNMPPQIKFLHPNANISTTHHERPGYENATKGDCAWVASTDPLFGAVADTWMETLIEDFGTDHWYQCDGFFQGGKPPWLDSAAAPQPMTESKAWDGTPVEPSAAWTPVWKAAWAGMAKTDPDAKWLYQGWAIRGWNDADGASRIRALYDAVPHGQWIPLDMDVNGIWRYWGNYSFFGAPFIWTTLHNMGGNDGLKGDMRLLGGFPSDATAAGASIAGVGATPEGIDQNPPYYEYVFDAAWHATAQPLDSWFAEYSTRRYGNVNNAAATSAWEILTTAVYNSQAGGWHDDTGVEWQAVNTPPTAQGINVSAVYSAWKLLVSAGAAINPTKVITLNYDIVNVGREVLAQLITTFEKELTDAVSRKDKAAAKISAATLMQAYTDLDELTGCDAGFLLGPWIAAAKTWANTTDAPASYYEWQARSQVSTWWPMAPSALAVNATFEQLPVLDNYANKHWNGLIRDFYAARVQCYVDQFMVDMPDKEPNASECEFGQETPSTYLHNYPKSLVPNGEQPPTTWPYNTSSLVAAKEWCCAHSDCGGVTYQNARYEVRAFSALIPDNRASSYQRAGPVFNQANLTKCVVTKELEFTQGSGSSYLEVPTTNKTLSLSAALISKYQQYIK